MNEYGLRYTLTGPAGSMVFNPPGRYSANGYYFVKDGINFTSEVRASAEGRGEESGSNMDNSFDEGLVGSLDFIVVADTVANRHLLIDHAKMVFKSLLGERGTGIIEWTPADGSEDRRVSGLRLIQRKDITTDAGTIKQMGAVLQTTRDTAESADETLILGAALGTGGGGLTFPLTFPFTFNPSTGGALTIAHVGTAPAKPVLEIVGGITTPQIVNPLTGERLAFTSEVAAGDFLEVDLFAKTIRLNGTVNRRNLLDRSQSTWFSIPPKTTLDLILAGGSFDAGAHLRARMRHAYA